ncbi:hypothetical protein [Pseudarthrobacter oxydans]|uniref:hypothetical protein n=1 Tax=Pseudarthrobacter oxydans TaxID=1671 RepID=UPI0035EBE409|nr:hypothetical protein GCM10017547_38410 [Pseudarthrobacter oxydans]
MKAGPRWVLTVILFVVGMAVWSVLGPMWSDASGYHGEPYGQKFAALGGLIVLTLVAGTLLVGAVIGVWRYREPTPLQKEALAYDRARACIDDEYEQAIRKVVEEARRRGLG